MKASLRISFLLLLFFCFGRFSAFANQLEAPIYVILWFDTEDYLLPADDDASKRLAEMLTKRKIRATFKMVGEKARVLERRGRRDVISALKKHCIGYHSDFHSVHPTPSEYLADCGLLDGIEEFIRREGDGAADVRRIFGVKTLACYGQPGSSWGAQTLAGLKQIGVAPSGVPCYVDEGTHVGLNEKPFWFAGALNVFHMGGNYTRMELHDPAAVEPAKKKVSAIADRLRTKDGGGLISIFYHPCEWVHQQFWDGVNFSRGANPPREQWKPPPQRTAEETEGAFDRFGQYIDHIRSIPGVKFITADELPKLYPDLARQQITESELNELARRILDKESKGLDFQIIGNKAFSVADQFELLCKSSLRREQFLLPKEPWRAKQFPQPPRRLEGALRISGLLGPDQMPPSSDGVTQLSRSQFRDALIDVEDFMAANRRIPSRIFIGAETVSPADFLYALAFRQTEKVREHNEIPLGKNLALLPEKYVAKDTPGLFGGWIIHKEGFRAPKIMEIARLQAWTLKPAVPNFIPSVESTKRASAAFPR